MAARQVVRLVRLGPRDGVGIMRQLELEEALFRTAGKEDAGWCFLNHCGPAQPPMVVLGFSGKAELLVDADELERQRVAMLRRFTGGGTVLVDGSTVFASFLMNRKVVPAVEAFPKQMMRWSASAVYDRAFASLGVRGFALRDDDYTIDGVKIGGNAQAISGTKWVHHTSFLYDFDSDKMRVLKQPHKQPEYRQDRDHESFLRRLKDDVPQGPGVLLDAIEAALREGFDVHDASVADAEELIAKQEKPWRKVTRWEFQV